MVRVAPGWQLQAGGQAAVSATSSATTVSALPDVVHLGIYQGDTFPLTVAVYDPDGVPIDLTGVTAKSEIRQTADSTTVAATFVPSVSGNAIDLLLSATDTAALAGGYVWDCQITDIDGSVTTLCGGIASVTKQVTR